MQIIMVLSAALVNFILGGFWYSLFKKQWLDAFHLNDKVVNAKDPKPYLIAFIGSVWTSYGLFIICKHIQPKNVLETLSIAVGMWFFIHVGLGAKHYAFAKIKFKGFVIDYGLDLIGLVIMTFMVNRYY
jgi:hypothetical protein